MSGRFFIRASGRAILVCALSQYTGVPEEDVDQEVEMDIHFYPCKVKVLALKSRKNRKVGEAETRRAAEVEDDDSEHDDIATSSNPLPQPHSQISSSRLE